MGISSISGSPMVAQIRESNSKLFRSVQSRAVEQGLADRFLGYDGPDESCPPESLKIGEEVVDFASANTGKDVADIIRPKVAQMLATQLGRDSDDEDVVAQTNQIITVLGDPAQRTLEPDGLKLTFNAAQTEMSGKAGRGIAVKQVKSDQNQTVISQLSQDGHPPGITVTRKSEWEVSEGLTGGSQAPVPSRVHVKSQLSLGLFQDSSNSPLTLAGNYTDVRIDPADNNKNELFVKADRLLTISERFLEFLKEKFPNLASRLGIKVVPPEALGIHVKLKRAEPLVVFDGRKLPNMVHFYKNDRYTQLHKAQDRAASASPVSDKQSRGKATDLPQASNKGKGPGPVENKSNIAGPKNGKQQGAASSSASTNKGSGIASNRPGTSRLASRNVSIMVDQLVAKSKGKDQVPSELLDKATKIWEGLPDGPDKEELRAAIDIAVATRSFSGALRDGTYKQRELTGGAREGLCKKAREQSKSDFSAYATNLVRDLMGNRPSKDYIKINGQSAIAGESEYEALSELIDKASDALDRDDEPATEAARKEITKFLDENPNIKERYDQIVEIPGNGIIKAEHIVAQLFVERIAERIFTQFDYDMDKAFTALNLMGQRVAIDAGLSVSDDIFPANNAQGRSPTLSMQQAPNLSFDLSTQSDGRFQINSRVSGQVKVTGELKTTTEFKADIPADMAVSVSFDSNGEVTDASATYSLE
jgi:hypothetical protein